MSQPDEPTEFGEKPDVEQWLQMVREHKTAEGIEIDVDQLLAWRDADRR